MKPIRLVIADDHPFYREGLCTILQTVADIEVIGEAATGEEVITQAIEQQPDVILMDIKMPTLNGLEATRQILLRRPKTKILVLTMFEDDDSVFAAMRAGARGYLVKDADKEELVRAIQAVYQDEAIFSPAIAKRMILYFAALPKTASAFAFRELTEREREILHLMARGLTNSAIAQTLNLSLKTVQNYVSTIFVKLHVANRAEAVVRAHKADLDRQ